MRILSSNVAALLIRCINCCQVSNSYTDLLFVAYIQLPTAAVDPGPQVVKIRSVIRVCSATLSMRYSRSRLQTER